MAPTFFIPDIPANKHEEVYALLASRIHHSVPDVGKRVYSIRFNHGCADWTATVGQPLEGFRYTAKRVKGILRTKTTPISDPAIVLAIFPGATYVVYWFSKADHSLWENPFMAGNPNSIVYFATKTESQQSVPAYVAQSAPSAEP